jgi:hypothetical protein
MARSHSSETPYRRSQSVTSHSQQHQGTPVLEDQNYMNAFSPPANGMYVMETPQQDAASDGRRSMRQLPPVDQNGSFRQRHGVTRGASGGFVTMDNSSTISSSSGNYVDAMGINNNISATAQQPLITTPRATQKNIVRVIDKDMTQQVRGRSKSVGQGRIRWFENRKSQLLGFCLTMAFLGVSVAMYSYRWTGLIAGSVNTIICGSAVVVTYCRKKQWHQHPNPIVHNRSVLSIFMAVCLLLNVLVDFDPSGSNTDCQRLAGITEFFFFTGEAWGLAMACDLWFSVRTNPHPERFEPPVANCCRSLMPS